MFGENYQVDVPVGKSGDWEVRKFEVSFEDESRQRIRASFRDGRFVPAGIYTGIYRGKQTVMSDTPDEIRDHRQAIRHATGHCLVNGLGLGMVAAAMLRKPEVTKVTVIELSADVIALVAPHWKAKYGDRIEIIQSDAMAYQPPKGVRYGCVWHDIFDDICADNLEVMTKLKRKYGRRCDWQGCWAEEECKYQSRRYR